MKLSQKFSCQKRVFLGLILWLRLGVSANQQHASLGYLFRNIKVFCIIGFFPPTLDTYKSSFRTLYQPIVELE